MIANVFLARFNLLPAFPMDGGRALRALLATRMEYTRATQRAAMIGQGMAILFGFIGLQGNPMLIFIALFVWIGAGQEASVVQMKSALAGIPLRRAMLTDFRTLTPTSTLGDAVDFLLTGSQQDFPVVANGRVEGMLTRSDLVKALTRREDRARRGHMTGMSDSRGIRDARDGARTFAGWRVSHDTDPRAGCPDRSSHPGQCRGVPDDSGGGTEVHRESGSDAPAVLAHFRCAGTSHNESLYPVNGS